MVSAMSLSEPDGSALLLGDMPDYLEIVMPRPVGPQQESSFVLDLANQSTVVLSVPATEETLLIKILPSVDPLPVNVYLGHGVFPTTSNYSLMTKMPHEGTTQEELGGNDGEYFLVLRPVVGPGIKSIDATVDISVFTSSCKFWNKTKLEWSTRGCRLGAGSTFSQTQCFCNHTTDFASSFFVMPNTIDMSRVAELFSSFAQNPVVVCFVGSLFLGYLLVVTWARRKDLQDTMKLKVTVLEDNDPLEDYRYLLSVSTGHRRGASTSSQVTITMEGSDGDSEPHHLSARGKPVFERGGVDLFLLTTPFSLGHLQSIRLWHDNSGSDPGWYVNKAVVKDLQTERKWYFLCNCWLAEDVGDCILDMAFPVATEMDLKGFSNLFYSKTFSGFSDGHLWFSVLSRPASSPFTRVQRVSCCFSLLMCTMLTSILFYGVPQDPSEQVMDIGTIEFTWQQFMIGMQSSLMVFPVNIVIVSIFRYTRPRERKMSLKQPKAKPDARGPKSTLTQDHYTSRPQPAEACDRKLEAAVKDIKKTACSLSKTLKSSSPVSEKELESAGREDVNAVLSVVEAIVREHLEKGADRNGTKDSQHLEIDPPIQASGSGDGVPPQTITNESAQIHRAKTLHLHRQIGYMEQRLGQLAPSHYPEQNAHRRALEHIHTIKELLRDQMAKVQDGNLDKLTQRPDPLRPEVGEGKGKRSCCGGGRGGGLPWWFVFLGWLLVLATSVVAGFFTMLYGLKFGKQLSISWLISMAVSFFESLLVIQPLKVLGLAIFFALVFKKLDEEDHKNVQFHKPTNSEAQLGQPVCRDSRLYRPPPPVDMEQMRRNRVKEQKAFALIKEILTYVGFMWMLLLVVYSQRDPNAFYLSKHIRRSFSKDTSSSMNYSKVFSWASGTLLNNLFGRHSGFITDGNSKLVGSARIRQVRVSQSACHAARPMDRLVRDCHAPYSWDAEAMGSYHPGWRERAAGDNVTDGQATAWTYQNQEQLRSNTIWGKSAFYRAGGFAADLGPDRINASRVLEYLYSNTWMDTYTRAVFVEFTVYNANVNLFCIVTLILETAAIGVFEFRSDLQNLRLYQSPGGLQFFIMTIEVFYFLFIFYYMYLQGKRMKAQRGAYFLCKWNLLELCIILLSWAALSMFIFRTLVGNRDMDYYHHHKQLFANFRETATADAALGYLIAFVVLLATIKLWHLLRLNPKLHMIAATLHRAWGDISGFLIVMTIMIVAYSVCGNLLFGWQLSSYMTLWDSVSTLISLQLGIFNYKEVLDHSPCLGSLFIGTSTVFMTYMVLNLFISVILMAFSYEREHHKPSEEEEIVDLMVLKLFSLLGIRSSGPPSGAYTGPPSGATTGPPSGANKAPDSQPHK
ncbi:polycystic kidney disease protein 1-like 2 [Gadus morhua]|uniref:polycystic kidney disease protein 1-like 2 n=1 Tax=Gadus morhua TaxID=8049 RepID=UPI0011B5DBE0|nr:polycystic kidney disease protein 1-like 2 [Gadus morhua]